MTSYKRKGDRHPQKITAYMNQPAAGRIQDGAAAAALASLPSRHISSQGRITGEEGEDCMELTNPEQGLPTSYPGTPQTGSPAKARMRLDTDSTAAPEVSLSITHAVNPCSASDPFASFPTNDQPILDTTLKDMLSTLRNSMQSDMLSIMQRLHADISSVSGRVSQIENQLGGFASTVNDLVDAHEENLEDRAWIKRKMADLEDRSRRNNIKIRGIAESVQPHELPSYAKGLFKAVLPDLKNMEMVIDRIHRLPKPPSLPDTIPRDVILRIHFYHVKEQLMRASRSEKSLPEPYSHLQIFADLSQYTLQLRRELNTVTKALRNHNLPYKWINPAKLLITFKGAKFTATNLNEGLQHLRSWGIIPDNTNAPSENRMAPIPQLDAQLPQRPRYSSSR